MPPPDLEYIKPPPLQSTPNPALVLDIKIKCIFIPVMYTVYFYMTFPIFSNIEIV